MDAANQEAVTPETVPLSEAEEDHLRAAFYQLLAALLHAPPNQEQLHLLANLKSLNISPFGQAINALADESAKCARSKPGYKALQENYETLFIGLGRGLLVPFASFYLTGFLNEKPLAELRATMKSLGYQKPAHHRLPEDHAGTILEIMHTLIKERSGTKNALPREAAFFTKHIEPWMRHFFKDLKQEPKAAPFYREVGKLGEAFLQIENEAFAIIQV